MRGRVDEIAGRLALIVTAVCGALILLTAGALLTPAVREWIGLTPGAAYPAGTTIDVPASVYSTSVRTVLLFARYNCQGCQRAKPFLAAVVKGAVRSPDTRVVLVTEPAHHDAEVAYGREIGLDDSDVVGLDLTKLRLHRVPTIVLVDGHGVVQYAFEGTPAPDAQDPVLTRVLSAVSVR